MTPIQFLILACPVFAVCATLTVLGWRIVLQRSLDNTVRRGAAVRTFRLLGHSFATTASADNFVDQARFAKTKVKLAYQILAIPVGALLAVVLFGLVPESDLAAASRALAWPTLIVLVAWGGVFLAEAGIEVSIATYEVRLSASGGR